MSSPLGRLRHVSRQVSRILHVRCGSATPSNAWASGGTLVHPYRKRCAMKAMTYRGPYKLRVEEKPDPRIEHPNDAIVRVELASICGSDLHLYHGMMPDTRIGH